MKFSGVSWRIAAIPALCARRIPKSSLHPENGTCRLLLAVKIC